MKIKLSSAIQIKNTLGRFVDRPMSIKTAYKIMKTVKAIEEEENFFNDKMSDIINRYGVRDESGNITIMENGNVQIIEGKEEDCQKEVKELENIDIEISDNKFSIEELSDLELTPREIFLLELIIE